MAKIIYYVFLFTSISSVYSNILNTKEYNKTRANNSKGNSRCEHPAGYLPHSHPIPLYENVDGTLKGVHHESGYLSFDTGDEMILSCKGSNLEYYGLIFDKLETTTLVCEDSGLFGPEFVPGKKLDLRQIFCTSGPQIIEIETNLPCGEENKGNLIQVAVQSTVSGNHVAYESCFEKSKATTLYVTYPISFQNVYTQTNIREERFKGNTERFDDFFVQFYYEFQTTAMNNLLGIRYWDYYKYGDELVIGQLFAKRDTLFYPTQRTTFNFLNTVPQWNRIYDGNWAAFKSSLRKLMDPRYIARNLTVYSGAWGILSLKDGDGKDTDIYLETNTPNKLPVPLFLYQVVHEPSTKKATAFLILNNPHFDLEQAQTVASEICSESVCPRSSPEFDWLSWEENNVKKGYVFCCDFADFRKVIKDVPDIEIIDLFP